MRKAISGVAVLVAVAVSGFGAEAVESTPLERSLPATTVAFVQVRNLAALGRAYGQSALAEAVRGSKLLAYFERVAGAAVDFGGVLLTGLSDEAFRASIGNHVGVALLDFQTPAELRRQLPLVFLVEVADAEKLRVTLEEQLEIFDLLAPQGLLSETKHAGATLYEVAPPNGVPFAYCFHGNLLVLGRRPTLVKLLDGLAADPGRLATDPGYRAVKKRLALPEGGLGAYANVRRLMDKLGLNARPGPAAVLHKVGLAGVQGVGVTMDFVGRKLRDRVYVHATGEPKGVMKLLTAGKPAQTGHTASASVVPPNFTLLASFALNDVSLWDRVFAALTEIVGPQAGQQMVLGAGAVQQNLGVQIKEGFFDTLAGELFVALDLSRLSSFMGTGRQPAPQEIPVIFGARLQNAPALVDTLNRIAAHEGLWENGIRRTLKKHRGVDVYTFAIPANPNLQPTYAIVEDVLLVGLRQDAIVRAVEAHKDKKSLATALLATSAGPPDSFPPTCHNRIDVDDAALLTALLELIQGEAPANVRRLVPELQRIAKGLSGLRLAVGREADGYSLTAVSDLGTVGSGLVFALCMAQFNGIMARRVEADFDKYAAALEEYRAKHQAYPETLEQLVPDFLPNVVRDRFEPKRAYGYSRGRPGLDGKFPGAWVLTSVGPDKRVDVPVEEFDPAAWTQLLKTADPAEVARLKRLVYQFRKDQFPDETKHDDEGDIVRLGGKGPAKPGATPAKPPPKADVPF